MMKEMKRKVPFRHIRLLIHRPLQWKRSWSLQLQSSGLTLRFLAGVAEGTFEHEAMLKFEGLIEYNLKNKKKKIKK